MHITKLSARLHDCMRKLIQPWKLLNNYKTRKVVCEASLYTNSVAHCRISWYISTSTRTVLHHTNQQPHLIIDISHVLLAMSVNLVEK